MKERVFAPGLSFLGLLAALVLAGCDGKNGSPACISLCEKYNRCPTSPSIMPVSDCNKFCADDEAVADAKGCRPQYDALTTCSNTAPNVCSGTSCMNAQSTYDQCAAKDSVTSRTSTR